MNRSLSTVQGFSIVVPLDGHNCDEPDVKLSKNIQIFQQVWTPIENELNALNTRITQTNFKKFLNKLKNDFHQFEVEYIPSCLISTGFNYSDRFIYLDCLRNDLIEKVSPFVIELNQSHYKNLKQCIESIVSEFLKINPEIKDLKRYQLNFDTLRNWHNKAKLLYKKQFSNNPCIPLIIIFDDVGSINRTILKNLISIIWSQVTKIPIFVIFVSFTSFEICLNEIFDHESILKLKITLYDLPKADHHFNEILDNVVLSHHCPILFNRKSLNALVKSFYQYDYSINRFIKLFKYAIFKHLTSKKINILSILEDCDDFNQNDYEEIRKCHSIRTFVENQDALMQVHFFTFDLCVLTVAKHFRKFFSLHVIYFQLILRCFYILIDGLPENKFGEKIVDLYLRVVEKKLSENEHYGRIKRILLSTSLDSLLERVEEIVAFLESKIQILETDPFLTKFLIDLNLVLKKFSSNKDNDDACSSSSSSSSSEDEKDELDLKKTFILQIFDKCFKKYLVPITSYPLHEIFLFENAQLLLEQKQFSPKQSVHEDLMDPWTYLKCDCCKLPKKSIIKNQLPNVSLLYKLQFEYPAVINIESLLDTFAYMLDRRFGVLESCEMEENNDEEKENEKIKKRVLESKKSKSSKKDDANKQNGDETQIGNEIQEIEDRPDETIVINKPEVRINEQYRNHHQHCCHHYNPNITTPKKKKKKSC